MSSVFPLRALSLAALAGLGVVTSACTADSLTDELAVEEADTAESADDGKADGDGTYTYFEIRSDFRRCASPWCGGYFVDRVNRSTTRCVDGTSEAECYVAELDLSALDLDTGIEELLRSRISTGQALLRGRIKRYTVDGIGTFGRFVASEGWISPWEVEAEGVFARMEPNGVRCAAWPCPTITERKLNGSARASIAELDWTVSAEATEFDQATAVNFMYGNGLIVAGDRGSVTGPGGTAKTRTVSKYFTKLYAALAAPCQVTGCSGQVCAEDLVFTTCQWVEAYACYATATCERQADGECGWTATEELLGCLGAAE